MKHNEKKRRMVLWPNGKFSEGGMIFERGIRKNTKSRRCNFISLKEISRLNLNNQCHQLPKIKFFSKEELMDEFSKIESSKKEENEREVAVPKLETVLGRIKFEEKTLGEEVSNVPSERTFCSNGNLRVSRIFNPSVSIEELLGIDRNPSVSIEELLGIDRNPNPDFTSWVRQFVKEGDMNEGEFDTPEKKRKIPANLNNERIRKKCKRRIFD